MTHGIHIRGTLSILCSLLAPAGAQEAGPAAKEAAKTPGRRETAHLGVQVELRDPANRQSGVVVVYVMPGSSAQEIGFEVGDEIRAINDTLPGDPETFIAEVRRQNVGSKQRFRVVRGGQEIKLEGRLKSQEKGLKEYQEILRQQLLGQPLEEPPGLAWWDPAAKSFQERAGAFSSLRGKHAVVFSFDDCAECKREKVEKLAIAKSALESLSPRPPLEFAGIFILPNAAGKEKTIEAASRFLAANPPSMPIAAAYYPDGRPGPGDREKHILIHNRGVVILDREGRIRYLQVVGSLEGEFRNALRELGILPGEAPAPDRKGAGN